MTDTETQAVRVWRSPDGRTIRVQFPGDHEPLNENYIHPMREYEDGWSKGLAWEPIPDDWQELTVQPEGAAHPDGWRVKLLAALDSEEGSIKRSRAANGSQADLDQVAGRLAELERVRTIIGSLAGQGAADDDTTRLRAELERQRIALADALRLTRALPMDNLIEQAKDTWDWAGKFLAGRSEMRRERDERQARIDGARGVPATGRIPAVTGREPDANTLGDTDGTWWRIRINGGEQLIWGRNPQWSFPGSLFPAYGYGRCCHCRRPWWACEPRLVTWMLAVRGIPASRAQFAVCTRCWDRLEPAKRAGYHGYVTLVIQGGEYVADWPLIHKAVISA